MAGITTLEAANTYLRDRFIPDYHATFTRPPAEPEAAFMPLGPVDLAQIFCEEEPRVVGQDNVLSFDSVRLQLAKQPGRPTCAGLRVLVRRHLDGYFTVWRGPQCLGRYTATAQFVTPRRARAPAGRDPLAGAPPRPPRAEAALAPRRRRGPRLPVGPGL